MGPQSWPGPPQLGGFGGRLLRLCYRYIFRVVKRYIQEILMFSVRIFVSSHFGNFPDTTRVFLLIDCLKLCPKNDTPVVILQPYLIARMEERIIKKFLMENFSGLFYCGVIKSRFCKIFTEYFRGASSIFKLSLVILHKVSFSKIDIMFSGNIQLKSNTFELTSNFITSQMRVFKL